MWAQGARGQDRVNPFTTTRGNMTIGPLVKLHWTLVCNIMNYGGVVTIKL